MVYLVTNISEEVLSLQLMMNININVLCKKLLECCHDNAPSGFSVKNNNDI